MFEDLVAKIQAPKAKKQGRGAPSKLYLYRGEHYTIKQLEEISGFNSKTISSRIYMGWDIEKIMNEPVQEH